MNKEKEDNVMAPTASDTRKQATQTAAKIAEGKQARSKENRGEVFESIGVIPEWNASQELQQLRFDAICERLSRLQGQKKDLEEIIKRLQIDAEAALVTAGLEKVTWDGRTVQVVHSKSGSKVIVEKLVTMGVDPDLIAECTEPGKEYTYVLIGKPGK
jgi:hypothetical protein